MSISFAKNDGKFSDKLSDFVFKYSQSLSQQNIIDYFIKIFDTHYLNFISYRKQRDLMMVNNFYQILLTNEEVEKDLKEKYKLSIFFEVKKNKIVIDKDVLPINPNEIVLHLENEISLLKSMQLFFNDLQDSYENIPTSSIDKKIEKIKSLNDDSILDRLTKDDILRKEVILTVLNVKSFSQIPMNYNFYTFLKKEMEFYCIK